jgi:hypothetical protein
MISLNMLMIKTNKKHAKFYETIERSENGI